MSIERLFGVGLLALGVGQGVLAVGTLAGPDPDALSAGLTGFLAAASFSLGVLQVTGRMPLDVTTGQRRLLRLLSYALIAGGVGGIIVGLLLVFDAFAG